jgi:hypothetical protein
MSTSRSPLFMSSPTNELLKKTLRSSTPTSHLRLFLLEKKYVPMSMSMNITMRKH